MPVGDGELGMTLPFNTPWVQPEKDWSHDVQVRSLPFLSYSTTLNTHLGPGALKGSLPSTSLDPLSNTYQQNSMMAGIKRYIVLQMQRTSAVC